MQVYHCGTEVALKRSEYVGVITGISIRETSISYEVSYYESGVYKDNWFKEYEFIVIGESKKENIGFK